MNPPMITRDPGARPRVVQPHEVNLWLDRFAAAVRARDIDAGQALFADDAAGFGTVTTSYTGLDDLVASQWHDVWHRTEGFTFEPTHDLWSTATQAVVAVRWNSVGTAPRRRRSGRATLVLAARADGGVQAVHSHFSMDPGTAS